MTRNGAFSTVRVVYDTLLGFWIPVPRNESYFREKDRGLLRQILMLLPLAFECGKYRISVEISYISLKYELLNK